MCSGTGASAASKPGTGSRPAAPLRAFRPIRAPDLTVSRTRDAGRTNAVIRTRHPPHRDVQHGGRHQRARPRRCRGSIRCLKGSAKNRCRATFQPIDILALQETTSNNTTIAPIVTNLNSYYNGAAVYAQSPYQATQSGGNSDGNGPNALVYNTSTLKLLASVGVGSPEGGTNGEYRQVVRYEFQPVGDSGSTGEFYVYVSHMKSGTTSQDAVSPRSRGDHHPQR